MLDRFPGYDVLTKRNSPSWNRKTREIINRRLALSLEPRFFTEAEFALVGVLADLIVPQPKSRPPIPIAALVDDQLYEGKGDGFRHAGMPRQREAWRLGLQALNTESRQTSGKHFEQLSVTEQNALLARMQRGELQGAVWGEMSAKTFFENRMAHDIVRAYYAHPTAWSEIGWGGPASPRGYVRMGFDERDPWEAAEVKAGDVASARQKNRRVG
jgi:hypothetical protein